LLGFSYRQVEEVNTEIECDNCGGIAIYGDSHGHMSNYITCKGCNSVICKDCVNKANRCPICDSVL